MANQICSESVTSNVLSQTVRTVDPTAQQANRVASIAIQRLGDSIYDELRRLQCEYREGVLILRGCVPCFYLKQLAQESVRTISGVEEIFNIVEVVETTNVKSQRQYPQ